MTCKGEFKEVVRSQDQKSRKDEALNEKVCSQNVQNVDVRRDSVLRQAKGVKAQRPSQTVAIQPYN